ncbi:phosphonate ABC transporter, permease protein PhnE [Bacillus salitolerans]|uniref:Phosphonate ABC transporter, permease protein PhnE n=1 Tax=Bacillus salitolerans TaxID=1437434 RepID=A0ABW4LNB1_9BACI
MKDVEKYTPTSLYSPKTKTTMTIVLIVVIGFYLVSSITTQSFITNFFIKLPNIFELIYRFFPPNWAYANKVWPKLFETIQMAVIATTVATIVSIPLSLLASRNITTNKILYNIIRFFLNVLRTIPDIILAVVFVGLFGIGAFPGIVALIIFSLGILAKLMSDTIEAIDMTPIEAMEASGANRLQTIWYSVVPQILPQFVSFSLYVFEINIRASVVLGLVGAGGIGLLLSQQINFFNYPSVTTITLIIFAVVVIIDYISGKIREGLL